MKIKHVLAALFLILLSLVVLSINQGRDSVSARARNLLLIGIVGTLVIICFAIALNLMKKRNDPIYALNFEDGTVVFGDGTKGARLPSGGEVDATYRENCPKCGAPLPANAYCCPNCGEATRAKA